MPTTAVVRKEGSPPAVAREAVQEALQVTWVLKGHLKNARISYIRVAVLLARVRDERMYAFLRHPDIEAYAWDRLQLRRTSLYRYLQVYDWIKEFHSAWLQPRPKGFIPELADAADLAWIERELRRKDLAPASRRELEAMRGKGLTGQLRSGEAAAFRRRRMGPAADEGLRRFGSSLRNLRKRGAGLTGLPPEVLAHLDAALAAFKQAKTDAKPA